MAEITITDKSICHWPSNAAPPQERQGRTTVVRSISVEAGQLDASILDDFLRALAAAYAPMTTKVRITGLPGDCQLTAEWETDPKEATP